MRVGWRRKITGSPRESKEEQMASLYERLGGLDALVEDLVATLDEFEVPTAEQEELLGLLGPMRDEIVEVESPQTGTPLPETYQAAPALT
jgi:hemoglobin